MEKNFAERHNDKAPKTPSRNSNSSDLSKTPATAPGPLVPLLPSEEHPMQRSRSQDVLMPTWDDNGSGYKRRASVDNAPRTPRRSPNNDVMDPARVVAEMFSQLPDMRRKTSDGAPCHPLRWSTKTEKTAQETPVSSTSTDAPPQHPRRSYDFDGLAEDAMAVQAMFLEETELTRQPSDDVMPRKPRRSYDATDLQETASFVQSALAGAEDAPQLSRLPSDEIPQYPQRTASNRHLDLPMDQDDLNVESILSINDNGSTDNLMLEELQKDGFHQEFLPIESSTPIETAGGTGMNSTTIGQICDVSKDNSNDKRRVSGCTSRTSVDQSHYLDTSNGSSYCFSNATPDAGSRNGQSMNSSSISNRKTDLSPRAPMRRCAHDDESTVATMEQIPEQALHTLDNSETDNHSSAHSDNDESTLLTMGALWGNASSEALSVCDNSTTYNNQQDCDNSTIFTLESSKYGH